VLGFGVRSKRHIQDTGRLLWLEGPGLVVEQCRECNPDADRRDFYRRVKTVWAR
jgi:hypothetical protein